MNSRVIIAGNAPSVAQIDYDRLPESYDVFRCNQFYFEDSYYLGKNVRMAFMNPSVLFEQYYTLKILNEKKEYNIENFCITTSGINKVNSKESLDKMRSFFPDCVLGHEILQQNVDLRTYLIFNDVYKGMVATSGVYMACIAALQGYKEIYLTGIDFYDSNKTMYAFDSRRENLIKIVPVFKNDVSNSKYHVRDMDIGTLHLLERMFNIKLYCISPTSPLSEYITLAPKISKSNFVVEEKGADCISDIQIPQEYSYMRFSKPMPDTANSIRGTELQSLNSLTRIQDNIYYKMFFHIIRLPSDIIRYIKYKKIKKSYRGGGGGDLEEF